MAASHTRLLQHLRRLAAPAASDTAADAVLLDRFIRLRDETAFAALVTRYGSLVLHLCRRVLGDAHAAEDASQATFLVLARRAASIRRRDALAAWLFGVARRVARKAQAASGQRLLREAHPLARPSADPRPDPLAEVTARELLAILDEEVQRLPEAYRLPLILCCLEGRTQEEAALQLGWTPGSVKGRLERGRSRLHDRLVRRGLTLSAVLAAVEVSRGAASASVAAAMITPTVRAAMAFTARQVVAETISGPVIDLAQGVLKAMWVTNLKLTAVVLLAATLCAGGAGLATYRLLAAEPAAQATERGRPARSSEPPARAEPRPRAELGPERAGRHTKELDEARDAVAELEEAVRRRERQWTDELIDVRKAQVLLEEQLRLLERQQSAQRERESAETRAAGQRVGQLREQVDEQERRLGKAQAVLVPEGQKPAEDQLKSLRATLDERRERLHSAQKSLQALDEKSEIRETQRTADLVKVRQDLVVVDEKLRLLERQQAAQREKVQADLEAASGRVRQIQGLAGPSARPAGLEGKIDKLLREVEELRRELRRRPSDGSHPVRPQRGPEEQ